MIARSNPVKLAAALVATSAHAAVALALLTGEPVQTEGAAGRSEVQLGASFADLVAGKMHAAETEDRLDPTAAKPLAAAQDEVQPVDRAQTEPLAPAEHPETAPHQRPQAIPGETPRESATVVPEAAVSAPLDTLSNVALTPSEKAQPESLPERIAALPVQPLQAMRPEASATGPLAATPHVPETEPVSGEGPTHASVARSLRPPPARTAAFEETVAPKARAFEARQRAARTARTKAASAAPRGNAQQNARAGSTNGSRQATNRQSGSGDSKRQATGNAAASNYPGVVMSCVSRAGRPNVSGGGTARVSFSVSTSGRVTGVGLAGRSGNAALDRVAVQLIRRVGSCPPPPPGARRSFSISITAR
ncbi:TonB family protein [Sagittula sp.]|uniref:energy transducer TonB family protein n=1 Tax=Sagittula sp. TaxID=2038081 RepID=UPI00351424F0